MVSACLEVPIGPYGLPDKIGFPVRSLKENVLVTKLDILDLSSIDNAVTEGIGRFGQIDVLLNNAGYGAYGPLESFSREKILRQFNTNVIGLMDVTRALLPPFQKK